MAYTTLDYIPDLTESEMAAAWTLPFSRYSPPLESWDFHSMFADTNPDWWWDEHFAFVAFAGEKYEFYSTSYYDPTNLIIYDQFGNAIVANSESDDPDPFELDGDLYYQDAIYDWVAPYSGIYYLDASWNHTSDYSFYAVSIYEDLTAPEAKTPNAGTSGNDILVSTAGNDLIDGDAGIDTAVFSGAYTRYSVERAPDGVIVRGPDRIDTLEDIERLKFGSTKVALDVDGNGGMAYRIYRAAFDRTPDEGGVGFWMEKIDGGMWLTEVAANFIASDEFNSLYGNLTNNQFAAQLYRNVLHREPDAGGLSFWTDALSTARLSKSEVLAGFSESDENQANVIGIIENGFVYA